MGDASMFALWSRPVISPRRRGRVAGAAGDVERAGRRQRARSRRRAAQLARPAGPVALGEEAGASVPVVVLAARGCRSTPSGLLEYAAGAAARGVPNFSEGRDAETIDALRGAFARARAARRPRRRRPQPSVFTLVGDGGELVEALVAASRAPSRGSTCGGTRARTARRRGRRRSARPDPARRTWSGAGGGAGGRGADRRGARAARVPVRRSAGARPGVLPARRPEELQRRRRRGRAGAGFGPARLTSRRRRDRRRAPAADRVQRRTCAATLESARAIAALVRESGGGFPGVRALGLDLPRAGLVQVSMNVEDWEAAALHDIVAGSSARRRPRRRGRRLRARRPDAGRRCRRSGGRGAPDRRASTGRASSSSPPRPLRLDASERAWRHGPCRKWCDSG